ncbi:MAG: hypothetical protein ACOC1F_13315, partial [Myxococcota bacterium]
GGGWLSLATAFACEPGGNRGFAPIEDLFRTLERMTQPVDRALRHDEVIGLDAAWQLEDWHLPRARPGRDQWLLGVGTLATAALAIPMYSAIQIAEASIAWALASGFTGLGLIGFSQLQQHIARPSPDAVRIAQSLARSSKLDVWGPQTANTLHLPVVVHRKQGRQLAHAPVASTLVRAQHGDTSLRVVVRSIAWPERTSRRCRIVPAGWLAAELFTPTPHAELWKQTETDGDVVRAVIVPDTKDPERWLRASLPALDAADGAQPSMTSTNMPAASKGK